MAKHGGVTQLVEYPVHTRSVTCSSQVAATRPVGQAVKTPPFHGGNMGSIPVRVTKKKPPQKGWFLFGDPGNRKGGFACGKAKKCPVDTFLARGRFHLLRIRPEWVGAEANLRAQEELYDIDFDGTPMHGTLEIRKEGSKIKMAIKWQDQSSSMELYDGESYQRYQSGQLVLERSHGGIDLTPFSTIDKLKEYALLTGVLLKFREEGDMIIVSTRGDKVGIIARFSKSEGRLLGAECSGLYNGQQVTVLTVNQIDFDVLPTE